MQFIFPFRILYIPFCIRADMHSSWHWQSVFVTVCRFLKAPLMCFNRINQTISRKELTWLMSQMAYIWASLKIPYPLILNILSRFYIMNFSLFNTFQNPKTWDFFLQNLEMYPSFQWGLRHLDLHFIEVTIQIAKSGTAPYFTIP